MVEDIVLNSVGVWNFTDTIVSIQVFIREVLESNLHPDVTSLLYLLFFFS